MAENEEETTLVIEASNEAVAGIVEHIHTGAKPDFTVTAAHFNAAGIGTDGPYAVISWETKSAGFGELTLSHKDGKLHIDTEAMSERFVIEVLQHLVKNAVVI
jgi:hypothetical protein